MAREEMRSKDPTATRKCLSPHSFNKLAKYEERRPRELKCTALLAPPTA
jgi:hypothetical protein